jgi:imidazolonepropionase-like amidohydrolase
MPLFLFTGGRFLDPRRDELIDGMEVLVEDGLINEVSDRPISASSATRVPIGNRTLMPGLVDCHIHMLLSEVNIRLLEDVPLTLLSAKGWASMRAMLMRGFTTLRDTGGADWGMKKPPSNRACSRDHGCTLLANRSVRPAATPTTGAAQSPAGAAPAATA